MLRGKPASGLEKNIVRSTGYSLPNDKILDWSKLKAFADDRLNKIKKNEIFGGWVENIVGKGENAGFQNFSFSHYVFKRRLF